MNKQRKVSESDKKTVAGRQRFKCANKPNSNLEKLENYRCPLWAIKDKHRGIFDETGYDIDHIKEFCLTGNDDISNLQALCKFCHLVKTKNFMKNHKRRSTKDKPDKPDKPIVIVKIANEDSDDSDSIENVNEDDVSDNDDSNVGSDEEEDNNKKIFKCDNCDAEFRAKQNLNHHLTHNTCKKPFSCRFCNKKYTSKSNMYTHIRTTCKAKKKHDIDEQDAHEKIKQLENENERLKLKLKKESKDVKKRVIALEKIIKQ